MNFNSLESSHYGELNGGNFTSLALILTKIWQFKGFFIILLFVIGTITLDRTVWDSGTRQVWDIKILWDTVPPHHCLQEVDTACSQHAPVSQTVQESNLATPFAILLTAVRLKHIV